jgi:xanthine dehydrogenase accessory factor
LEAEFLRRVLDAVERGEGFALVTVLTVDGSSPGKPGQKMMLFPDGRQEGTVGGGGLELRAKEAALGMIASGTGGVLRLELDRAAETPVDALCGGTATLVIEVYAPAARILLCGAGHVSWAVSRILAELGLAHLVVDARPETASVERFPHALKVHQESPPRFLERAGTRGCSHVLILTHHHALDQETLLALSRLGFGGWVGMIGSRRKWGEVRRALLEQGVAEEWLDRVRCPVGLEIGARNPAQIAVSIAAQIIREMAAPPLAAPGSPDPGA